MNHHKMEYGDVMRNPKDKERAMYIYHARKDDKRTFVDIGRELGISGNRVRLIYRQMDWDLNGMDADHHKDDPPFQPTNWKEVIDPDTGESVWVFRGDQQ